MMILTGLVSYYIKWGFESRLKQYAYIDESLKIISNGDLKVG